MCSLFGLIDFKECLSTHTKNKILNTLARECQVRGTDATGIAYNFNDRLRIYKRPLPARKMKIHIPHGVNVVMGHTRMTTQGNAQFNQNNHPFLGHVDGNSFALAHNGVLWNDKELRTEENLPMTSVETDSYVAVQLLEQQKTLDFDSLKSMAEKVEGSFVFTVLDKDNSIWFVVGDNPLCVMFYDGFLIYASTQEILCKTLKKLRLKAPIDILEPQEGEIMKINRNGRITTGTFTPHTTFEHWWRKYPFYHFISCYAECLRHAEQIVITGRRVLVIAAVERIFSPPVLERRVRCEGPSGDTAGAVDFHDFALLRF